MMKILSLVANKCGFTDLSCVFTVVVVTQNNSCYQDVNVLVTMDCVCRVLTKPTVHATMTCEI